MTNLSLLLNNIFYTKNKNLLIINTLKQQKNIILKENIPKVRIDYYNRNK